jgi:hypothetical protein
MKVITKPASQLSSGRQGIMQKVREQGLAYYEWSFLYSRLLPPELQYLCREAWCGLCHTQLTSLEDARHHYLAAQHEAAAAAFLATFHADSPRLRPERQDRMDHTAWQQMYDRRLPARLTGLCGPDTCSLCHVGFPDEVEMMRHYKRSQHRAAVDTFLETEFLGRAEQRPRRLVPSYWYLQWRGNRLPVELLIQCTPTHCHLCSSHLGDRAATDSHYTSGEHANKVDLFLEQFFASSAVRRPRRVEREEVAAWTARFPGLPPELMARCTETRCDLCQADLANHGVAKSHYEGQQHTWLVRNYLAHFKRLAREGKGKHTKSFSLDI